MNDHPFRKVIFACIAGAAVILGVLPPESARALGLGEIRIKSAYNRTFLASIPVYLDPDDTNLSVEVGSQADYNLIQIGRLPVVDALKLAIESDPDRPGEKIVVVSSKEPVAAPSFNLVIRATAGSGSILENYFLAVDFRKSLSLDLPEPEEAKKESPKQEAKKKTETAAPPPPAPVERKAPPSPAAAPEPKAPPIQPLATASVAPPPPPPAPPPPVLPEKEEQPAAHELPPEPQDFPLIVRTDADATKNVLQVRKGDSLYSIARKIDPEKTSINRVVVAMYLENKASFIGKNIHVLRNGTTLSYAEVNRYASMISEEEARRILDNHWKALKAPKQERAALLESPLDRPLPSQEVYDFVEEWKRHWVEGSPLLASDYADEFAGPKGKNKAAWLAARQEFCESSNNLTIEFGDIKITRKGATIMVEFPQTVKSDQFASFGQKTLALKQVSGLLKILREEYQEMKTIDSRHLWTVQVAEYASRAMAQAHAARLAARGLPAYEENPFPNDPAAPQAVMVGRIATKGGAVDLAKKLRGLGENSVKVVRLPFSVRLAVAGSPEEAAALAEKLAKDGYSPFQVEEVVDGKTRYSLYLGAFAKKGDAEKALATIHLEGAAPAVTVP